MNIYDNEGHTHTNNGKLVKLVAEFNGCNISVTEIFKEKAGYEAGVVVGTTTLPLDVRGIYTSNASKAVKRFAVAILLRKLEREASPAQKSVGNTYNKYSNELDCKVLNLVSLIASREAVFVNRKWEGVWGDQDKFHSGTIHTLVEGGWYDMVVPRKLFDENNYDSLNRSTCQRYGYECIDVSNEKLYNALTQKFGSEWVMVPTICTLVGLDPTREYNMDKLEKACMDWLVTNRLLPEYVIVDRYDEYDQLPPKSLRVKSKRANATKFSSKPKSKNISRSRIRDLLID